MSAWGPVGGLKSCDSLLERVETNDDKLVELVILPMKSFGSAELDRLSNAISNGSNTNLKSVSASGHKVSPESLKRFGCALSEQSKQLGGANNGITDIAIGSKDMGDAGIIAMCEGLEESNGGLLRSLDLGWKGISQDGISKIGATFAQSTHLSDLNLSRNGDIGCSGLTSFCNAAKQSAKESRILFRALEQLDLSACNIGASGVQSLAEFLVARNLDCAKCSRVELNLSSNPIGSSGCHSVSVMVANISFGSTLSKLNLSQCDLSDEGILSLAKAGKSRSCTGLARLDLSANSITQTGACALAESLIKSFSHLIELNLAKNNLGFAGVVMIMKCLHQRSDITNDHPVISDDTVMIMKSVLQDTVTKSGASNSKLKILDLTETDCGIEGASASLMTGRLTSLRLFNNKLGSDGFYSISKFLQGGHPSIVHLDLGGNSADEDSVVALLDAIASVENSKFVSNLAVLEIGGNAFGSKADAALTRLMRVWPMLDVAHDKPIQREVIEE